MAIRALTIGPIFMRFVLLYLSIVCQHFVCFTFSNLLNVNILFRTIACNICIYIDICANRVFELGLKIGYIGIVPHH